MTLIFSGQVPPNMTFSEKVKFIRTSLRLSQAELAAELGCTQTIISAYEAGLKKPSFEMLEAFTILVKIHKIKIKFIGD